MYTAAGDGYDEVIGQFARQAEGIAMTGKAADAVTVSAGTDVNIDLTASPVALERVVAKVLLVCDTYTDDGGAYVRMSDNAARPADDPGWICLSEVRYALNTVNRKVYLNAPSDGKDPNYEVDPYVAKDGGGNYVSAPMCLNSNSLTVPWAVSGRKVSLRKRMTPPGTMLRPLSPRQAALIPVDCIVRRTPLPLLPPLLKAG